MGVGQVFYFILIPIKRQKPLAPAFPFKKAQELLVLDFYGPMTARNYENCHAMSTAFTTFFHILLGVADLLQTGPTPRAGGHSSPLREGSGRGALDRSGRELSGERGQPAPDRPPA